MAAESNEQSRASAIKRALALATEAQDLLDSHGGPPDAAVHLDLCCRKLQEELARSRKL
jgi:hypothetical protein